MAHIKLTGGLDGKLLLFPVEIIKNSIIQTYSKEDRMEIGSKIETANDWHIVVKETPAEIYELLYGSENNAASIECSRILHEHDISEAILNEFKECEKQQMKNDPVDKKCTTTVLDTGKFSLIKSLIAKKVHIYG